MQISPHRQDRARSKSENRPKFGVRAESYDLHNLNPPFQNYLIAGSLSERISISTLSPGKDPEWKKQNGAHELEHQVKRETNDPERKKDQPHEGKKKEHKKGNGPADHE